jgi:hypothetical protein
LLTAYWEDYQAASGIADSAVVSSLCAYLDPVRRRLPLSVDVLLKFNEARKTYPETLLEKETGQSCLGDYCACYKAGASTAMSNWCDGVKRSVRRALGLPEGPKEHGATDELSAGLKDAITKRKTCPRCKLRHVAPCIKGASTP